MANIKHLNEAFDKRFESLLNENSDFELETLYKEMWDEFKDYVKSNGEKGSFEMWDGNEPSPSDKIGRKYNLMKLVLKDHGYKFETSGNGRGVHFEYWKDSKGKMPNEPITDKNLKKKKNESCEDCKPSKKKSKKPIKESFNPNTDFTKETLWQLRQEVPIGSLFTNDFRNSFGIPARTCQDFFDGYMDELDYMMQEDGLYENGYDEAFWDHLDEYDNADNLWDWYSGTEQPFGEVEIETEEDDDDFDESLKESINGEDISSQFRSYKAFTSNFKPVKIIKKGKTYFVYKEDAEDENDYEYYANSKDEIEGLLAGAVKAKNKRFNEALNKGKFKTAKGLPRKNVKEDFEDNDKLEKMSAKELLDWARNEKTIALGCNDHSEAIEHDNFATYLRRLAKEKIDSGDKSLKEARMYDLTPQRDSRKSFYGKAKVMINDDDSETLYSYNTPIMTRTKDGNYKKHWYGWSNTTGRHIAEFSGMNKKKYSELPVEESIKSRKKR